MARKQPVGYVVRRPLTLWGRRREIDDYIPASEVASLARIEAMVRSGRFKAVYEETDRGKVIKSRTGKREPIVEPVVVEKAVEPVVPKRRYRRKTPK